MEVDLFGFLPRKPARRRQALPFPVPAKNICSEKPSGIDLFFAMTKRRSMPFVSVFSCLVLCCLFVLPSLRAQVPNRDRGDNAFEPIGDNPDNGLRGKNPFAQDTLKKKQGGRLLDADDTLVYGPSTTHYIDEETLFRGYDTLYVVDTTLTYFHRYSFRARKGYRVQNLGNLGTPSKDIYGVLPEQVGNRLGLDALEAHVFDSKKYKYYNSRSPYTEWYYVDGGNERVIIDVLLSQNIKPNWSAAFRYKNTNSALLIRNNVVNRSLINVGNRQFTFSTWYQSPNRRYSLLSHYINAEYRVNESGGLVLDSVFIDGALQRDRPIDLFLTLDDFRLENRLADVNTSYAHIRFKLYQEFALFKNSPALQVFHRFTRTHREYVYADESFGTNRDSYPNLFLDENNFTIERIKFQTLANRAGLKGKAGAWFYALFLAHKSYRQYRQFDEGHSVPLALPSQTEWHAQTHYRIGRHTELGAEYVQIAGSENRDLKVYAKNKYVDLGYRNAVYRPTRIQGQYFSNFFLWNNEDFVDTRASSFWLKGHVSLSENWRIKPYASMTNLENYVYFDTLSVPRQAGERQNLSYAGLALEAGTGIFRHSLDFRLATSSELIRVPAQMLVYQLSLDIRLPKKKKIRLRPGLDFRYTANYRADAYQPITKQYVLQDKYEVGAFPVIDFFFNFRVNRTRFFIKVPNLLYNLGAVGTHYFVTPGYAGQARSFEFGLNWRLFD